MILRTLIILTVCLSSALSAADELPKIVFFGGHLSSQSDMDLWKHEVSKNPKFNGQFEIISVKLPSNKYSHASIIRDGKSLIEFWVHQIDGSPKGSLFILAGHSSGSGISNEIAKRIRDKNKIKLIILDGFAPFNISQDVETHCWSAVSGTNNSVKSLNTDYMRSCSSYTEYMPLGCNDKFCLHFSLVNLNASNSGVNAWKYRERGYAQLKPNLAWLHELISSHSWE